MTRALAPAEPEGYARQGGRHNAAGLVSTQYHAKLLATLAQEVGAPAASVGCPEPLRERELEVLALIAAGKSNKEIAAKLFVSMSTIKTHTNNLYRKLGAHSRTQAVACAREMGVL